MRRFILFLCAALMLAACDDTPVDLSPSPTLTPTPAIVVPGAAKYNAFALAYSSTAPLNPLTGTNKLNADLAPLIYEGLFAVDENFNAQNILCEDFSADELVWTFTLKSGVFFSDGAPLTATDAVYSLNAARASDGFKSRFADIASISAPDEQTLVITTARQLGHLQLLLDIPIIPTGSADDKNPPGTGAYVFIDVGEESYLRLADSRRNGATQPRIQLVDLPEVELLVSGFEVGTVSAVSADATATDPIVYGGDYEEWRYPTSHMVYMGFNTVNLADAELRRALSSCVDRAAISAIDMMGYAAAFSFGEPLEDSDIEQALADLGYEDTDEDGVLDYAVGRNRFPLQLKLLVCTDNSYKMSAARRIADNLAEHGIAVALSAVGWDAYNLALKNGVFDLYIGEVKLTADLALDALVSSGGALNYGGFSSETVDELLSSCAAADADGLVEARQNLYNQLDLDPPIAPILFKNRSLLAKRGVAGAPAPTHTNVYRSIENW